MRNRGIWINHFKFQTFNFPKHVAQIKKEKKVYSMRLIRHKGNAIKMILIKVGKSTGCKVSIFGNIISPVFFFFFNSS